jgi:hypothetical protein
MSDTVNPYQSPESAVNPVKPLVAQGVLTETMLMYLKGASPWLRFLGVLGFIICGFLVLGAVLFFTLIPLAGDLWYELPWAQSFADEAAGASAQFGVIFGLYFLIIAALCFFPFYFIYNFGAKIRGYLVSGADQDLEKALKNNKSLWKFTGILTIVMLAFIPVLMIIGIITAVVASL